MADSSEFDGGDIAELLIQIGRLAYAQGSEENLTPTQWMALRYFARANRFSRTVSAFADYHATTRGTVSQTVKTLTEHGYLRRRRSDTDRRSVRFDLTEKGLEVIAADPLARLIGLIDGLAADVRQEFAVRVSAIAGDLARALQRPGFGLCKRCQFLAEDEERADGRRRPACRYLNETLEPGELAGLCVNFAGVSELESRSS